MHDTIKAEFCAAMARFGPFAARPQLAVGVSGGADSTSLALLARDWAVERGGRIVALIVDHDLRNGSGSEAQLTRQRLETRGIAAQVITLTGLAGSGLQEKARHARHNALSKATRQVGAIFLLLGHQAADQGETVAMRAERGNHGLEGMADWTARNDAVILRPLLTVAPAGLREFLRSENMPWVEDPSNYDKRFERVRIRLSEANAVPQNPICRQQKESHLAMFLARYAIIRPEGFAIIVTQSAPPAALAALLRTIAGAQYAPRQASVADLASKLRPSTLGGVRVLRAGRLGPGWLLVREPASCAPPIPASHNTVWDGRFRLAEDFKNGICGSVGTDSPLFRTSINLPAAVVAGLPCIRTSNVAGFEPHLAKSFFFPPMPAAPLPFLAPQSSRLNVSRRR